MSSNPFENALWIDIRVSRRLTGIMIGLCVAALMGLWWSELSLLVKIPVTLFLVIYANSSMQRYGQDVLGRLPIKPPRCFTNRLAKNRRSMVTGIVMRGKSWKISLAGHADLPAKLRFPVWRSRYFILLRYSLLVSDYPRSLTFLLTPWQTDRESFRLLYARLAWARDERRDD